jgi:hypothetical protein
MSPIFANILLFLCTKKGSGTVKIEDLMSNIISSEKTYLYYSHQQKYSRLRWPLQKFSSLYKAETAYEGRLKVILLLQVSSHDFEPTYVILVLIFRILPDQPK